MQPLRNEDAPPFLPVAISYIVIGTAPAQKFKRHDVEALFRAGGSEL